MRIYIKIFSQLAVAMSCIQAVVSFLGKIKSQPTFLAIALSFYSPD